MRRWDAAARCFVGETERNPVIEFKFAPHAQTQCPACRGKRTLATLSRRTPAGDTIAVTRSVGGRRQTCDVCKGIGKVEVR